GGARTVELPVPRGAAPTFHGRDVFAPAAAALARGEAIDALGIEVNDPVVRRTPEARRASDGTIDGEVILVDRFGNAVTNLISLRGGVVDVAGTTVPVYRTYAEAARGAPVAVVGSTGFIEIAIRDGSAASVLGLSRGARVKLRTAG
ncbi:MAG TPA: SAM-dependent chlorinase/fluorinase, partial [Gemmatimonadaceae bacterium]